MVLKTHYESGEAGKEVGHLANVAIHRSLRRQQQAGQAPRHLEHRHEPLRVLIIVILKLSRLLQRLVSIHRHHELVEWVTLVYFPVLQVRAHCCLQGLFTAKKKLFH